jgi:hypothetical protein
VQSWQEAETVKRAINLNDLTKFAPISEELNTGLSVRKVGDGMLLSYRGLIIKRLNAMRLSSALTPLQVKGKKRELSFMIEDPQIIPT